MLSIRNAAELDAALSGMLDPTVRALLCVRRDQLTADSYKDIGEFAQFFVFQRGDALSQIEKATGLTIDDVDLGPPFEFVERHGRWLEAVTILNDDGFAVTLLVPDCACTDPALLLLLLAAI